MSLPALLFGLLWIPALGLGMYALRGRGGCLWLLASLGFAVLGFFAGHGLALWRDWAWGWVGPWALGPAVFGAMLALILGYTLFRPRPSSQKPDQAPGEHPGKEGSKRSTFMHI